MIPPPPYTVLPLSVRNSSRSSGSEDATTGSPEIATALAASSRRALSRSKSLEIERPVGVCQRAVVTFMPLFPER